MMFTIPLLCCAQTGSSTLLQLLMQTVQSVESVTPAAVPANKKTMFQVAYCLDEISTASLQGWTQIQQATGKMSICLNIMKLTLC